MDTSTLIQVLVLAGVLFFVGRWLVKQCGWGIQLGAGKRQSVSIGQDTSPITSAESNGSSGGPRRRLRELGINLGILPPGHNNAITDVPGVKVGHATVKHGDGALVVGQGPARTGVTAIIPHSGNIFSDRVSAGAYVLNGNGVVTGLDWIAESGFIEGPIVLTNTHSVGDVSRAVIRWMNANYPEILATSTTLLPIVGECDDSPLNDINGFHVKEEHVFAALDSASSGPVVEGAVGAGTGMTCYRFKGGIGTASRVTTIERTSYTVGVLVNCNHGLREQLIMCGVPVGQILDSDEKSTLYREGSIIIVVATNAPLSSRQLERIAKRASMGLARTGATANNTSGDFILAFSTSRTTPRSSKSPVMLLPELSDDHINPLFQATVEATEEAVLNALCMAQTTVGRDGNVSPALPLERVRQILAEHQHIK